MINAVDRRDALVAKVGIASHQTRERFEKIGSMSDRFRVASRDLGVLYDQDAVVVDIES